MKSRFFILIFFIVSLFFFSSCNKYNEDKCIQNEIANLNFTQGDLSIIPYAGNETLTFKNNLGDSVVFSKVSKKKGTNVSYEYYYPDSYHKCLGDYITSESYLLDFYASTSTIRRYFEIYLQNGCSVANPKSVNYISFIFCPGDTLELSFVGTFISRNDTLFNLPNKKDSIIAYYNQITIGPKSFSHVYELYGYNIAMDSSEWYNIAYYSRTDGLVGVRTNKGRLLYLDSKK